MRTNGYYRSKKRNSKLKKLRDENCYFVQPNIPDEYLKHIYLSGKRKICKKATNKVVRKAEINPNYSGYRKASEYWLVLF